jgi:hypothetical protein
MLSTETGEGTAYGCVVLRCHGVSNLLTVLGCDLIALIRDITNIREETK